MTERIRARNARSPRVPLWFRERHFTEHSSSAGRQDRAASPSRLYQPPANLDHTERRMWQFTAGLLHLRSQRHQPAPPHEPAQPIQPAIESRWLCRTVSEKEEDGGQGERGIMHPAVMPELTRMWKELQDWGRCVWTPVPWVLVDDEICLETEEGLTEEEKRMMSDVVEILFKEGKMWHRNGVRIELL